MSISINGTNGLVFNDASTQSTAATGFGFKNRIINGAMAVAQRGSVNVSSGGSNTYLATDRFTLTNYWGSGQINSAQSTTVPSGFSNSLSLTVATAPPLNGTTGYACALWQSIEGFNIADCYNTSFTLSFWVRSSVTGTYSITFANNSSSSVGDGNRIYLANYTISQANTWEQKTITVNLAAGVASGTWNTSNGAGLCVAWNLGAESNRKGNNALDSWQTLPISGGYPIQSSSQVNWASNSGATFYITGVQLEKGSTATSFDYRPYTLEEQLTKRYYYVNDSVDCSAYWNGGNSPTANFIHPVNMRAAPSISLTRQSGDGTATSITIRNVTNRAFNLYWSGTANTMVNFGHNGLPATYTANSEL